uniref:Uncharacterized protein n=1 Tax=Steinernema glaseri TaxID=37863 RepID=A0A1I8A476_9BILA
MNHTSRWVEKRDVVSMDLVFEEGEEEGHPEVDTAALANVLRQVGNLDLVELDLVESRIYHSQFAPWRESSRDRLLSNSPRLFGALEERRSQDGKVHRSQNPSILFCKKLLSSRVQVTSREEKLSIYSKLPYLSDVSKRLYEWRSFHERRRVYFSYDNYPNIESDFSLYLGVI